MSEESEHCTAVQGEHFTSHVTGHNCQMVLGSDHASPVAAGLQPQCTAQLSPASGWAASTSYDDDDDVDGQWWLRGRSQTILTRRGR